MKYKDSTLDTKTRTDDLLSRMTLEEKVAQLCQIFPEMNDDEWILAHSGSALHSLESKIDELQERAKSSRLGIPYIFGIDAIHGHCFRPGTINFPSQLAMSSSWNPEIVKKVAEITAEAVAIEGIHWTFSPVLCLPRDIRWGRVEETFGEDPFLIGELADAMIKGYQGERLSDENSILACAKHYAGYGETQGGRDSSEAEHTKRKMLSLFLPPFEKVVKNGCRTLMIAYQSIDGVPCVYNKWLLNDILKDEWGFEGFLITDWGNVGRAFNEQKVCESFHEASVRALKAGNDMIMCTQEYFPSIVKAVKDGEVSEGLVDRSCRRILRSKFELGLFDNPQKQKSRLASKGHLLGTDEKRKVALKAAEESIVLLENKNNFLPLKKEENKSIAVIGPGCDDVSSQLGDWTFGTCNDHFTDKIDKMTVTPYRALKKYLGENCTVRKSMGCLPYDEKKAQWNDDFKKCYPENFFELPDNSFEDAVKLASESDLAVFVAEDTHPQVGEQCDRADMRLGGQQEELLKAVSETGTPTILVLMVSKPHIIREAVSYADAVLCLWNPGMEGGTALAEVIFGDFNPLGKTTISWPKAVEQQPVFYNQFPGWHSDRYCDMDSEALYPFGYGLSYTSYEYSEIKPEKDLISEGESIKASITVTNTGKRAGIEIVQLYINDIVSSLISPVKELKAFKRVKLDAGESKTLDFEVPFEELSMINENLEKVVEPGEFELYIGASSKNESLRKTKFIYKK